MNIQLTFDFYHGSFDHEKYFKLMIPVRVREERVYIPPNFTPRKKPWLECITDKLLGV
jgi:hypothetical protein